MRLMGPKRFVSKPLSSLEVLNRNEYQLEQKGSICQEVETYSSSSMRAASMYAALLTSTSIPP